MALLTKELRDYLALISPCEGHADYLKNRFDALPFSQALEESRLLYGLIEQGMLVPAKKTTVHTWEEDDRNKQDHCAEALSPGERCLELPDWFTLTVNGLNYAQTRRKRNLKWIITAVLAPFILWTLTALIPVLINVIATWWLSFN